MNDSFGNYLVQKILERLDNEMIEQTLIKVEKN